MTKPSERKKHLNVFHINFLCRPLAPGLSQGQTQICPWDKPGFAGLPLCEIRRKPGFVPGFHRIFPRDKPGEIPGTNPGSSQDQPDEKIYVYVPFSCLKTIGQESGKTSPVFSKPCLCPSDTRQFFVTFVVFGGLRSEATLVLVGSMQIRHCRRFRQNGPFWETDKGPRFTQKTFNRRGLTVHVVSSGFLQFAAVSCS